MCESVSLSNLTDIYWNSKFTNHFFLYACKTSRRRITF